MYRLQDGIEFLKSLPDKSVDGIFTDPPWLMKAAYHARGIKIKGHDKWESLITQMTDEGSRVLNPETGRCFIWLGMTSIARALRAVNSLEYRFMFFCYYIPPRYVAGFECSMDPILYFAPKSAKWVYASKGQRRVRALYQHYSTGAKDTFHPCARPFKSVKDILHDLFKPGEYVVDPFAGSDTTGVAAREFNLNWDSCEIDSKMYETGIERHKQMMMFEKPEK